MKQKFKDKLNFVQQGGHIIRGLKAITNSQVPSL